MSIVFIKVFQIFVRNIKQAVFSLHSNIYMPLDINPKPDTIIRILMTFKGLEKPIDVTEQKLQTPKRTGFTAVEWGGTEIK